MILFVVLAIACAVGVVAITARLAPDDRDGMAPHLPTLAGGLIVFGSFFLIPWVKFALLNHVVDVPPMALEALPRY